MYKETSTVELKSQFVDDIKQEIIAFANSNGGDIYVGIDDNSNIVGIKDYDKCDLKVSGYLRDGIYPNLTNYVKTTLESIDGHDVMVIHIKEGSQKPYFDSTKGPKPSGVYIRVGNSKRQATYDEIIDMQIKSRIGSFENIESKRQVLTFSYLRDKFTSLEMSLNDEKLKALKLLNEDGKYNFAGFLFSDQNDISVKVGIYNGTSKVDIITKKDFDGCLVKQVDYVMDYVNLLNYTKMIFPKGKPEREDISSYPEISIRESLLNAICHRQYNYNGNVMLEFYDDRLEITSPRRTTR